MSLPGRDNRSYHRAREHGDKRLPVDLPELADGGKQDGEHENEHAGARRQRTHQFSRGER